MTDLINGLGGPAGFGEQNGPTRDDDIIGLIDITSVFEGGLTVLGQTYTGLFIDENAAVSLGRAGDRPFGFGSRPDFFVFLTDHLVGEADTIVTPGGTSQGTNAIYYDLDPVTGSVTVTWDDVKEFFRDDSARNAYQIRFLDLPGGSDGSFAVEYRYEAINWGADFLFEPIGFLLPDPFDRFFFSDNNPYFVEFADFNDPDAVRGLTDAGVIRVEFDGDSITTNVAGQEEIEIVVTITEGTDGNDVIVGTDDAEGFLPGRGRDVIQPGLGADLIDIEPGANTVRGTAAELLGDQLIGFFENDRLLFDDIAFGAANVTVSEDTEALIFDIDGDGTEDGQVGLDQFLGEVSALTATARAGTYVALVEDLPDPGDRFFSPDFYDGDQNTRAYLRGDGRADFVLRLDGASTTEEEGTALGVYTYDREGVISNVRLLTTDVIEAGDAEFLLDDVGRGENIGVFVLRPDEVGALDDIDSFAFVNETGREADFDDGSYVFAEVNGEIISADLVHSARDNLNADLQQHAVIGMTDRPGLTIAMEETLFSGRDFDDVVLSIERLAVELA